MYQLTSDQKLANYEELISSKKRKVEILQREISNLEAKAAKLRISSQGKSTHSITSAINFINS